MATRIPRDSADAAQDPAPAKAAPRARAAATSNGSAGTNGAARNGSAPSPLRVPRSQEVADAEAPATPAVKAVRAARANARAASVSSAPGRASRTVRIRPDADAAPVASPSALEGEDPVDTDEYDEPEQADAGAAAQDDDYDDEYDDGAPVADEAGDLDDEDLDDEDLDDEGPGYEDEPAVASARPPARPIARPVARPVGEPDPVAASRASRAAPAAAAASGGAAGAAASRGAARRPAGPPSAASRPGARPAGPRPAGPPPPRPPAPAARPEPATSKTAVEEPARKRRPVGALVTAGVKETLDKIGLAVQLAALICGAILIIYVLFVAANANTGNGIFKFFHHASDHLVLGFKNLWKPRTAKSKIVENYLTAAAVYLAVGALARRLLRK